MQALRIAAIVLAYCLLATAGQASISVAVAWDPNPADEAVTHYTLYWSPVSRETPAAFTGFDDAYQMQVSASGEPDQPITATIPNLPDDTTLCYFSVTAHNEAGLASDYSAELGVAVIRASAAEGGTLSPSGTSVVELGTALTVQVTPDAGYDVADVLVDGASVGAVTTYTLSEINASHTVSASFIAELPNTYVVAVNAGAGGSVSPSGSVSVSDGGDLTVSVTPNTGYAIADVLVDGASVGAVTSYALTNISAAHTVSARFVADALVDSDNNQLPDTWERQYFGYVGVDPTADPDGDGRTNIEEYLAGTDPLFSEAADPSLTPAAASPISGATVVSRQVQLTVDNPVHDAGLALTYEFQVSTQRDMGTEVAAATGIEEARSGVTAWSVPTLLDDQTRYYWRARTVANGVVNEWSSANTFYVDSAGLPTTTTLVAAEYVAANADMSMDILDPTSGIQGLGVDVPVAALPYDFILTVSTVANPPAVPRTARLAGSTVEFGPHGRPFAEAITILLPYTEQTLADAGVGSAAALDLLTYNTATLQWEVVPNAVTDYAGQRIVARVDHFSMYSLGVASDQTPEQTPVAAPAGGGGGGGCFIGSLW